MGNIFLVLGVSMFAGGLKYERQKFNQTAAGMGASLLLLAAAGLIIPALFHFTAVERGVAVWREQSFAISLILLADYVASLLFTLKMHRHLFAGEAHNASDLGELPWTRRASITVLTVVTCLLALMSEMLVGVLEPAVQQLGLTQVFIGVILVALVRNAAEHSTAVMVALKNKMDLAYGIAVGSNLQIALLVAPLLVFASYLFGTRLDLIFTCSR